MSLIETPAIRYMRQVLGLQQVLRPADWQPPQPELVVESSGVSSQSSSVDDWIRSRGDVSAPVIVVSFSSLTEEALAIQDKIIAAAKFPSVYLLEIDIARAAEQTRALRDQLEALFVSSEAECGLVLGAAAWKWMGHAEEKKAWSVGQWADAFGKRWILTHGVDGMTSDNSNVEVRRFKGEAWTHLKKLMAEVKS